MTLICEFEKDVTSSICDQGCHDVDARQGCHDSEFDKGCTIPNPSFEIVDCVRLLIDIFRLNLWSKYDKSLTEVASFPWNPWSSQMLGKS